MHTYSLFFSWKVLGGLLTVHWRSDGWEARSPGVAWDFSEKSPELAVQGLLRTAPAEFLLALKKKRPKDWTDYLDGDNEKWQARVRDRDTLRDYVRENAGLISRNLLIVARDRGQIVVR